MKKNLIEIKEFTLGGEETFEAEIIKSNLSGRLFGNYRIRIKEKNIGKFGDVGVIAPGISFVNNKEYPHRKLYVDSFYKKKGIATWMYNKLQELGDILPQAKECVSEETKLKEFYTKMGYKIIKEIENKTDNVMYFLLERKK